MPGKSIMILMANILVDYSLIVMQEKTILEKIN